MRVSFHSVEVEMQFVFQRLQENRVMLEQRNHTDLVYSFGPKECHRVLEVLTESLTVGIYITPCPWLRVLYNNSGNT